MGNANLALIRLSVAHDQQSDAMGLASMFNATVNTIGPAVAGLCLFWMGHTGVIALAALLVTLAMFGAQTIKLAEELPPRQPFLRSFNDGAIVFWRNRELVFMTVVIVLTNAAEGLTQRH